MTTVRDLGSASESWRLIDVAHRNGEERARSVGPGTSPAGWYEATVPGLAAQDLLLAGRIPDPYWGNQVLDASFIEQRDFVYTTTFRVSDGDTARVARLRFDSLDTFAAVFLNGELIARHENQFRRLSLDVTGKLRAGDNVLAVAFEAGWLGTVRRAGEKQPFWNEPWERLWVRKSQMSFGWDWAARTPTVGFAGPVKLELADGLWAGDLHATGKPERDGSGTIRAALPVEALASQKLTLKLLVDGEVRKTSEVTLDKGAQQTLELSAKIDQAKLWFPRELGEPHLYRVSLRLEAQGKLVHEANARVGIREIELVKRDPQSPNGKVFYFRVNGQRLWAKGDNWLPLDFLHTRVTKEEYASYLKLLMAGGLNCIRIWGGGIVEHEPFYDLCDELGLIVWQDFYYACGLYPSTPEFLEEARREAEDIVLRLRSRTSIALWCGNNENEVLTNDLGGTARFHPLYYDVIASVCQKLDPERAYWPGSPASESRELHADSDQEGDRHNWDVWFQWKKTNHITDDARFNSEFGAQSLPQRDSLESFIHPDDLWSIGNLSRPEGMSPGLLFARHGAQMEKLFGQAGAYGKIWDLDAAIATTQYFQAETVGRYIRHYRRNVRYSGGTIVWNYTSTWPSICWALVDWYRRPKHAFYECKRCFRPTSVGIEPLDDTFQRFGAWVSRDRAGESQGELRFELRHVESGKVIESQRQTLKLGPFQSSEPAFIDIPAGLDRSRHALVASFEHQEGGKPVIERDFRYLTPLAEVRGFGGKVTARFENGKVELKSSGWRPRVGVESWEAPAIWDDNYLDLLPGETRTLSLELGNVPAHVFVVADLLGRRKHLPPGGSVEL
jgi:beta-mannosidase